MSKFNLVIAESLEIATAISKALDLKGDVLPLSSLLELVEKGDDFQEDSLLADPPEKRLDRYRDNNQRIKARIRRVGSPSTTYWLEGHGKAYNKLQAITRQSTHATFIKHSGIPEIAYHAAEHFVVQLVGGDLPNHEKYEGPHQVFAKMAMSQGLYTSRLYIIDTKTNLVHYRGSME